MQTIFFSLYAQYNSIPNKGDHIRCTVVLLTYMQTDKRPEETMHITSQQETVTNEAEKHTTTVSTDPPGTHSKGTMEDIEGRRDEQQKADVALGGGLGTLAAVLILILLGVVLGWVWSSHRNRNK